MQTQQCITSMGLLAFRAEPYDVPPSHHGRLKNIPPTASNMNMLMTTMRHTTYTEMPPKLIGDLPAIANGNPRPMKTLMICDPTALATAPGPSPCRRQGQKRRHKNSFDASFVQHYDSIVLILMLIKGTEEFKTSQQTARHSSPSLP
eukprot:SAG31_NODE_1306_length_8889_cov_17.337315_5_plen_147_part_00